MGGDSDEEGIDSELLDSDEDEIDDDDDDDDEYDGMEETSLEAYTTPMDDCDDAIDEYKLFCEVLAAVQNTNPAWYNQLTGHLSENQGKALNEVMTLSTQRIAAKESKKIQEQGGCQFSQANVPSGFNFGAPTAFGK